MEAGAPQGPSPPAVPTPLRGAYVTQESARLSKDVHERQKSSRERALSMQSLRASLGSLASKAAPTSPSSQEATPRKPKRPQHVSFVAGGLSPRAPTPSRPQVAALRKGADSSSGAKDLFASETGTAPEPIVSAEQALQREREMGRHQEDLLMMRLSALSTELARAKGVVKDRDADVRLAAEIGEALVDENDRLADRVSELNAALQTQTAEAARLATREQSLQAHLKRLSAHNMELVRGVTVNSKGEGETVNADGCNQGTPADSGFDLNAWLHSELPASGPHARTGELTQDAHTLSKRIQEERKMTRRRTLVLEEALAQHKEQAEEWQTRLDAAAQEAANSQALRHCVSDLRARLDQARDEQAQRDIEAMADARASAAAAKKAMQPVVEGLEASVRAGLDTTARMQRSLDEAREEITRLREQVRTHDSNADTSELKARESACAAAIKRCAQDRARIDVWVADLTARENRLAEREAAMDATQAQIEEQNAYDHANKKTAVSELAKAQAELFSERAGLEGRLRGVEEREAELAAKEAEVDARERDVAQRAEEVMAQALTVRRKEADLAEAAMAVAARAEEQREQDDRDNEAWKEKERDAMSADMRAWQAKTAREVASLKEERHQLQEQLRQQQLDLQHAALQEEEEKESLSSIEARLREAVTAEVEERLCQEQEVFKQQWVRREKARVEAKLRLWADENEAVRVRLREQDKQQQQQQKGVEAPSREEQQQLTRELEAWQRELEEWEAKKGQDVAALQKWLEDERAGLAATRQHQQQQQQQQQQELQRKRRSGRSSSQRIAQVSQGGGGGAIAEKVRELMQDQLSGGGADDAKGDDADVLGGCPLVASAHTPGVYRFGLRSIVLGVKEDRLMVRVGGGFIPMRDFLATYGQTEARKYHRALAKGTVTAAQQRRPRWTQGRQPPGDVVRASHTVFKGDVFGSAAVSTGSSALPPEAAAAAGPGADAMVMISAPSSPPSSHSFSSDGDSSHINDVTVTHPKRLQPASGRRSRRRTPTGHIYKAGRSMNSASAAATAPITPHRVSLTLTPLGGTPHVRGSKVTRVQGFGHSHNKENENRSPSPSQTKEARIRARQKGNQQSASRPRSPLAVVVGGAGNLDAKVGATGAAKADDYLSLPGSTAHVAGISAVGWNEDWEHGEPVCV